MDNTKVLVLLGVDFCEIFSISNVKCVSPVSIHHTRSMFLLHWLLYEGGTDHHVEWQHHQSAVHKILQVSQFKILFHCGTSKLTLPSPPKWKPASDMYTSRRLAGFGLQPMICGMGWSGLKTCVHVCMLWNGWTHVMYMRWQLTSWQTTACSNPSNPPSGESRLPEIIRLFTALWKWMTNNYCWPDLHTSVNCSHITSDCNIIHAKASLTVNATELLVRDR